MSAQQAVVFLFLGLGPGAVYAALGLGLVVTYRGSGVLNLAYGTMAMYPAYVFATLRETGDLVFPGIPGTHHLAAHVGTVLALGIALVIGAVLGLVAYLLVFRPLQSAPPLARVVGSLGVLLTLQSVVVLRHGADPRLVATLLPRHRVTLAATSLPADRVYLVVLVVVIAMIAALVYRSTRFGVASRAATDSPDGVALLGVSAVRLGAVNWAAGGVIAGLFGILLAPIAGLNPSGYSLLIVPALIAALAGRMDAIGLTVVAGLALGVVQSEATLIHMPWSWLSPETLKEVVPFVVLVVLLLVFTTALPTRGIDAGSRLPPPARAVRRPLFFIVGLALVGAAATTLTTGAWRGAVTASLITSVLCMSVVVVTGYAGQISLAQTSIAGVGAFVLSRVATDWHVPFPVGAMGAALACAAVAALLGLASSRSRGMIVALLTLGGSLAIEALVFHPLSRGVLANSRIDAPHVLGLDLAPMGAHGAPRVAFGLFVVVVAAAIALGLVMLRRGALGHRMLAVRSNERAAAAAGVDVRQTKIVAFAVSGFIAGVGGALVGYSQGALSGSSFAVSRSFLLLAATYLGGLASLRGALFGGLVLPGGIVSTVSDRLFHLDEYALVILALIVTTVVVRNPEGTR